MTSFGRWNSLTKKGAKKKVLYWFKKLSGKESVRILGPTFHDFCWALKNEGFAKFTKQKSTSAILRGFGGCDPYVEPRPKGSNKTYKCFAQFAWSIRICGILKMIIAKSYFGIPCVGTFPFSVGKMSSLFLQLWIVSHAKNRTWWILCQQRFQKWETESFPDNSIYNDSVYHLFYSWWKQILHHPDMYEALQKTFTYLPYLMVGRISEPSTVSSFIYTTSLDVFFIPTLPPLNSP